MTTTIQAALAQGIQFLSERQDGQVASQGARAGARKAGRKTAQQAEREHTRTARLDAQVLLAHVLDVDRSALYAHPERVLSPEQERRYRDLLARRVQGEPVAYLTGHKEFFGLDFLVDRRVLIPRPETELLVEVALRAIRKRLDGGRIPIVADIGTGSGAIPIAIAFNEPRLPYLYASDISEDALTVAALNSQRHHVEDRVRLLHGDLAAPLPEPVDILTANLPYVGLEEEALLDEEVLRYEPRLALFSGQHGLAHIERLFTNLAFSSTLLPGATLLLEIGYAQREALERLLARLWPSAHVTFLQDYAGWDRVVQVEL
jgi:release factor glutamine methyltransferase